MIGFVSLILTLTKSGMGLFCMQPYIYVGYTKAYLTLVATIPARFVEYLRLG